MNILAHYYVIFSDHQLTGGLNRLLEWKCRNSPTITSMVPGKKGTSIHFPAESQICGWQSVAAVKRVVRVIPRLTSWMAFSFSFGVPHVLLCLMNFGTISAVTQPLWHGIAYTVVHLFDQVEMQRRPRYYLAIYLFIYLLFSFSWG